MTTISNLHGWWTKSDHGVDLTVCWDGSPGWLYLKNVLQFGGRL